MEDFIYIDIDDDGNIIGRKWLTGEINDPKSIRVTEDFDPTNKRWNGEEWEEYIPDPEPEPEYIPTQLDRIEAAVNLSNEEIANAAVDAYTLELLEGGLI